MQEVNETLFVGRQLNIDVTPNDSVDIRCGGPQYLGYDFVVDADLNPQDLKKEIERIFYDLHRSYMRMSISSSTVNVPKNQIWSLEQIFDCIKTVKLL